MSFDSGIDQEVWNLTGLGSSVGVEGTGSLIFTPLLRLL